MSNIVEYVGILHAIHKVIYAETVFIYSYLWGNLDISLYKYLPNYTSLFLIYNNFVIIFMLKVLLN
jgi:hypothetical protein